MKILKICCFIMLLQFSYMFAQWQETSWKSAPAISFIFASGDTIIVNNEQTQISFDFGKSWKVCSNNLPNLPSYIAILNNHLYAIVENTLYISYNFGSSWTVSGKDILPKTLHKILGLNNTLIISSDKGFYRSENGGTSWIESNNGITELNKEVNCCETDGNFIYAGISDNSGFYISDDLGKSWKIHNSGLPQNLSFDRISISGSHIYISSIAFDYSLPQNMIFYSDDGANSWLPINNGNLTKLYNYSIASISDTLFISNNGKLFNTDNKGNSWNQYLSLIPEKLQKNIDLLLVNNSNIFAVANSDLFVSTDKGKLWSSLLNPPDYGIVETLSKIDGYLCVGTYSCTNIPDSDDGIFYSPDEGNSWNNLGLKHSDIFYIQKYGNLLLAGGQKSIFTCPKIGNQWTERVIKDSLNFRINAYTFIDGDKENIIAGTQNGIYISDDTGISWEFHNKGLPNQNINCLNSIGNYIYAGLDSSIYYSEDFGKTWLERSQGIPSTTRINKIIINNNEIILGTSNGVFISSDSGITWQSKNQGLPIAENGRNVLAIAAHNNYIFACIYTKGVYLSMDSGITWTQINTGLDLQTYTEYSALEIVGDYVYLGTNTAFSGTYGDKIYKAKLADFISSGIDSPAETSDIYIFPNPATDYIYINIPDADNLEYSIVDLSGNIMSKGIIIGRTISINSLNAGIYWLRAGMKQYNFIKE